MITKIFSLVARMTNFVETQKHAPRRAVNLSLRVSLAGPLQYSSGSLPPSLALRPTLKGKTRDISADGLALSLPAVHIGGLYFTNSERKLRVSLDLDHTTIEFEVLPVRYERPDDNSDYIVGAKIVSMSEAVRAEYDNFVQNLGRRRGLSATLASELGPKEPSLGVLR
jgi:c-di-GMP-binding flagellar brake protein YcgR